MRNYDHRERSETDEDLFSSIALFESLGALFRSEHHPLEDARGLATAISHLYIGAIHLRITISGYQVANTSL